ncbi:MAG: YihA family ribosome biogenesis GTP-binding protein [Gemmatimonadetes bacterium]|nr:YihA family ribosome biogenesis GTP-binding protein [Gemmatimonadota bacterium]
MADSDSHREERPDAGSEGDPVPLIIRSVEFVGSLVSAKQSPPSPLPQIAFAGRSNVGKSSLINRVLGRPKQKPARVSATPGKTQALNFFEVNGAFYVVDLPGSGYARAPERIRRGWEELVSGFLTGSPHLRGVVYLVDARHPPTAGDQAFVERLAESRIPTLITLTKLDKLRNTERERLGERVIQPLAVPDDQVVRSSSKTGEGIDELLAAMGDLLAENEDS